jgi:anti-sigma factor RsiW
VDLHELTPGYALDALDPDERARYEEHLAVCAECRAELQGFWEVSGALGRAAGGPAPPARLRARILEQARAERPNVVPLRRRRLIPVLSAASAVAAAVALGLGLWGVSLARDLDRAEDELSVLGDPSARTVASGDGEASLVVTSAGDAVLVVRSLPPAPEGKDYEIWVFESGVPQRAGLFERPGVTRLERSVERGQLVAVTLEPDGGLDAPSGSPLLTATA